MITDILTGIALLIIILGTAVLLTIASIWIIAHLTGAQEVTCNWIFCEFKNTIKEVDCFQNGERVPCDDTFISIYSNNSNGKD
jgi:hypothetical protein